MVYLNLTARKTVSALFSLSWACFLMVLQFEHDHGNAALSIRQLITYNTVKQRSCKPVAQRHNRNRETPLPIYIALKLHAETRKRGLIGSLHDLGLPPQAVSGVFTTAAVDNIDHNPSSTTACGSFHGTAISLLQHPTDQHPGIPRPDTVIDETLQGRRAVSPLPDAYTLVDHIALPCHDPLVPPAPGIVDHYDIPEANQHALGNS